MHWRCFANGKGQGSSLIALSLHLGPHDACDSDCVAAATGAAPRSARLP
eukprot:CAMPEP_0170648982 /NCGR_PEP_ID=MMETSP0224-20130122/45031_1 /TAXON_ID=285029 /ORGANISM="Togula jolla, Strain CCCM 725" /LENGTH=48 /DNA_ID= /DNA_START= /DNA_END= /DNA_ORIENTATION=